MKRVRHLFAAGNPPRSYATTQVELPGVMAAAVLALGRRIPDNVLSFDDDGKGGREERPHVTCRYGIESDDPEAVRSTIELEAPVSFTLGSVDYFPAHEGAPYDVVFVSCWSDGLHRLHSRIGNATPCVETQAGYWPHVTLAYVQPGKGALYAGDSSVNGLMGQCGDVTHVSADGTETRIPLRSGAMFRDVGEKERKAMAGKGHAMPDGSFPVETKGDLANAIKAIGRAKNPAAVKRFLKRRAKALKCEDLIPKEWGADQEDLFSGAYTQALEAIPEPFRSLLQRGDWTESATFADGRREDSLSFEALADPIDEKDVEYVTVNGVEYVVGKPQRIFRAGKWPARDGRQVEVTDEEGRAMEKAAAYFKDDIAFTYDHENDVQKGSQAAGWLNGIEWRPGDGLYATVVKWTKDFWKELKAGAWRFISGDAYGVGNPKKGEVFHPRLLLAASAVPKPALPGLSIALSANASDTPSPSEGAEKENDLMDKKEICKLLGVSEDTPDEKVSSLLKERFAAAASTSGSLADILTDEKALAAIGAAVGEKLGAQLVGLPAVQERIAAAASDSAAKAAGDKAAEQVKEQLAARDREQLIDATLLHYESDAGGRRVTPAEREDWRANFRADFDRTKKLLEGTPKRSHSFGSARSFVDTTPNDASAGFSPEAFSQMDRKEQGQILTRVAQWAAETRRPAEVALVECSQNKDAAFQASLRTGSYTGRIRGSFASEALDIDLLKYVHEKVKDGAIPDGMIPRAIQQFAVQQTFATIASTQAPTRHVLPVGVGYTPAPKIARRFLPEFSGAGPNGAFDEQVSYPVFGTEGFEILPDQPIGDTQKDIPRRSWGADWPTIKLNSYSHHVPVGRRVQTSSNASLPIGAMALATQGGIDREELRQENIAATLLRTVGTYGANYRTLTGDDRFSSPNSDPITLIVNVMMTIQRAIGRFPDIHGGGSDPFWALRKNKTLNEYAGKYTGTQQKPGGLVPAETIIGLFGMDLAVSEQIGSTEPGGANPAALWGTDWIIAFTGGGETVAPRFGLTVTSPGASPLVRIIEDEMSGSDGADLAAITMRYKHAVTLATAGFLLKTASDTLQLPS